jgi:hypothetical protein
MRLQWITPSCRCPLWTMLALALGTEPAGAQVREVVVGITTACPYENAIESNCWSSAYRALTRLEGIKLVDESANGYNCTARVYLKHSAIPDPDKWASQFKESVGQAHVFRGVELTIEGMIAGVEGGITVRVPGIDQTIALRPLEHKLQWNARKGAARQPEPDERDAYEQLASQLKVLKGAGLKAKVTGPLRKADGLYTLEVREFFPITP